MSACTEATSTKALTGNLRFIKMGREGRHLLQQEWLITYWGPEEGDGRSRLGDEFEWLTVPLVQQP